MDKEIFIQEIRARAYAKHALECPEGICDGSGWIQSGEHDDIYDERCLCNPKMSVEEMMDDDS